VQIQVSAEINAVVERAVRNSVNQNQFFVGVEHLFNAVLSTPDDLPEAVTDTHLNSLFTVMREVNRTAWRAPVATVTGDIVHTPRAIAVIGQANKFAERWNRGPANGGHLLLAILEDELSAPSRVMHTLKLGRSKCREALRAALGANKPSGIRQRTNVGGVEESAVDAFPVEAPQEGAKEVSLATLTRDLSAEAREGTLSAAVGRDAETLEILQVLTRKNKNNVMIVGEAGVGKTQVVEGLALATEKGELPTSAPQFRYLELNLAALMSGTQFRGALEEKITKLLSDLRQSRDVVLFIDEAHLIMGAGATDGDAIDFSNLLKPALARGDLRVIGATTVREYRKFVEADPAIERRFQMVRLEELSPTATLDVLKRVRPSLEAHHDVRISKRTLEATVRLTGRYLPNLNFPDKAIDVLDQACARHRLTAVAQKSQGQSPEEQQEVTPHCLRKVLSQLTGIPLEELTAEERKNLGGLAKRIGRKLIGQDDAVASAVAAVKKSRAGLADPDRPDAVMLFLGPSGVGKTQLCKLLAEYLFGSPNHLVTFDMSEFVEEHSVSRLLGAPPGYQGADEEGRLSAAMRRQPFSILLFDEIEKAHPRIFDIFLPIFDEGRLKDNRGREVSFKNAIIIMTSNIGAEHLRHGDESEFNAPLMQALREHFRPEFINRIDQVVPFFPLLAEDVRSILRLEINALRRRLKDRQIKIHMYQRAYEFLAERGYSPDFGARELRRAVDKHVTTPISEMILDDKFQPGDIIDVKMEEEKLVVCKGAPREAEGVSAR
jgi:ATP-dependent Clp protease ATP-binding subunit ClpC